MKEKPNNTLDDWISFTIEYIVIIFLTFLCIRFYAQRRIKQVVKFLCGISWFMAFSLAALIPIDV